MCSVRFSIHCHFLHLFECGSVSEHVWESLGVTGQDGDVRWSQAAHLQLHSEEINSFHLINIIRFSVMSEFESDVLTELPGST